jgi:hypothetical protein
MPRDAVPGIVGKNQRIYVHKHFYYLKKITGAPADRLDAGWVVFEGQDLSCRLWKAVSEKVCPGNLLQTGQQDVVKLLLISCLPKITAIRQIGRAGFFFEPALRTDISRLIIPE